MAGSLSEQLFDAINLIASKKVSNLPYDQTIVCTIVDNTNAVNGEYTVNDGTSEFVTYSENPDYRVNTRVYVNIPNNDRLNKTHITGEYIEDANGNYQTYISPMNNFVDLTGDLIPSDISEKEFSLLANDPQRRFITVWTSPSGKVYRNYTCLGIQGNFRTNFPADTPTIGNYGLAVYLDYTTADGTNMSKILYFDCSEMFGNPYIFTTKYLQEKLFDISGMDAITSIQIAFYQSKNFEIVSGTPLEYAGLEADNLFVSDIQVRLGELLTKYETDTVRLICNDDLQYKFDEPPLSRKMYLRWIHKEDNSLIVIDQNEDNDLAKDLTVTLSTGKVVPNYVVRWYRYNLKNGVHDTLAGNFWTQMDDVEVPWSQEIIPNDKVQNDRFKVIIEYPYREGVYDNLINLDEDYAVLYEAAKDVAIAGGVSETIFKTYVERYIREIVSETDLDESGQPMVVDFYTKYCENEAVVALYQNSDIANLRAYITETKSKIQYYESDVVTFENKVEVALEEVDLIQGLNIIVDADNGGHNGVYRLYDETNNIINTNESRKVRHMTATYTSIALGIDSLDQAEEIMWCFPLECTMIQLPQEGYEFDPENGDHYFEVDALDATVDVSAAQAQRIAEAERYDQAHGTNWALTRDFSVEQLTNQMTIEIQQLDVSSFGSFEAYWARVKEIKAYYQVLVDAILTDEYKAEITNFAADKGKWGVIRRTGTEIVTNDLGEQLIEVGQNFRIKPYYVPTYTNNNIVCLVKRNKRVYKAVATLHFASLGTSGTEATFFLTMCDEDGYEIGGLIPGSSITIRPYLYDYNNAPIDFESQVGYKWYSEPYGKYVTVEGKIERQNVIEMTQSGNDLILTARADMELSDGAHAILQGEAQYTISYTNGKQTDPNVPLEEKQRTVTLTTYLPIPLRASSEVTHISGATKVIYDSNGTNPSYYKDPYELHTKDHINTDDVEWVLMGDEIDDPTTGKYYPTLSSDYALVANNMYFANMKPISAIAYGQIEGMTGPQEIWVQPIIIMQNRYGSAMMNNWDGSLQIDEENGTILSQMVGAGVKNEDNTFSGVLMGNVALADEKIGNKTGLGLYGFHHGEQAFGLNVDGTAFLGKAGSGRIEFDGNKGTIQSYNYQEPHTEMMYDEDGQPLQQTEGQFPNTRVTESGSGLKIDLDDSTISAYGKTGSLIINTNKYGQPLFVIRDADYSKTSNGNTLFYVSSNASDPVTGNTYDAKYFLQSANYTGTDPEDLIIDSEDEDAPTGGYATGALFDLEKGKLDIHGKAGRVFIHGDGSNDLFQIRGWKGSGANFIKNTLMNVSPNRYYLQSIDYKANKKGFKMDISSGKIMASDLNLKAGNETDGMIQLNTSGMPYFSVTTGTDYVEEKLADNSIVYACYDAIDLEDVDAQFEPGVYWIRNTETPGYYAVESYIETLGTYSNADAELYKQNFYYRYKDESVAEKDRVLTDANMVKITVLPPETWNFEATLLPDQPRLYQLLPNPIVLDDSYFFTAGRQYYADAEGHQPVTLYDNAEYYKFKELRAAGTLYRQNLTPIADDGSKGWKEGRVYYTCDNPTAAEKDRKYTAVRHIVSGHDKYEIWVANKYYYKTVLDRYARSISGYAGEQDYYEPKKASTNQLTPKEVLNLTDDDFKKTAKTIVYPDTYFYDTPASDGAHKLLFYYNDDWEKVEANEAWSANYKYGIKRVNTGETVRAIDNVVDDERFIYSANKWYYEKEETKYEALDKWQGSNFTYYYLWYDIYLKAENVIEKETSTLRIFEDNKYYRYIANKKFLLAQDFSGGEHYYTANNPAQLEVLDLTTDAGLAQLEDYEITLCDVNSQPYVKIAEDGMSRRFVGASSAINGKLYWLDGSGVYNPVAINETTGKVAEPFSSEKEYYLRYEVGTKNSEGTNSLEGTDGIHSVKLVNITKGGFELKSHNWYVSNTKKTGLHFYISSNSRYDDSDTGVPQETGGDDPTEFSEATAGTLAAQGIAVGGGYIEGYGYYKDSNGNFQYPRFVIDWRAGASHYPINVNNVFKVYWNGRVDCTDIHSLRGTIGGWYIDQYGLYSFKPPADRTGDDWASTGVALLSGKADPPNGILTESSKGLRIAVGTFNGGGHKTGSEDVGVDGQDVIEYTQSTSTETINVTYYDYAKGVYEVVGEGDEQDFNLKTSGGIPLIYGYKKPNLATGQSEEQLTANFRSNAQYHESYYTYNGKYFPYTSYLVDPDDKTLKIKSRSGTLKETFIIFTDPSGNQYAQKEYNGITQYYKLPNGPWYENLPMSGDATSGSVSVSFTTSNKYGFFAYSSGRVVMYKADIDSATIVNGTMDNAKITNGSITNATINDCTVNGTLYGATIKGGNISGSTITGSTIKGGTITGGSIRGGTITGGTISGATISGGTISGTNINGGTITGATLTTGNTTITGGGVYCTAVQTTHLTSQNSGLGTASASSMDVTGYVNAGSVSATNNISGSTISGNTINLGGTAIQSEVACSTLAELKTALGITQDLGDLAFADTVDATVNISGSASKRIEVKYTNPGYYSTSEHTITADDVGKKYYTRSWHDSSEHTKYVTVSASVNSPGHTVTCSPGSGTAANISVDITIAG